MEEDAWSRQVDVPGGFNLHICNQQPSITQVLRAVKRQEHGLFNCIASVIYDYQFISQVSESFPGFPLLANLRCGAWYIPRPAATCYYKSTDGHSGEWSFSTVRLNLHVALLACKHGGVCIVDATRRGKTFPDALTKTIPIWAAVLNRAISRIKTTQTNNAQWDDAEDLYLPAWISGNERNQILSTLDTWVDELISVGADLSELAIQLRRPLRCVWVSQNEDALLEEWKELTAGVENLPYTPIILISASIPDSRSRKRLILDAEDISSLGLRSSSIKNSGNGGSKSEEGAIAGASGGDGDGIGINSLDIMFDYIPGAGDDEESWAKGLTPRLMWNNWKALLDAGPEGIASVAKRIIKQYNKQGWGGGGSGAVGIGQESSPGDVQWIGNTNLGLCTLPLSQENLSHAVLNVSSTDILEIPEEHRVQVIMEKVLSAGGLPGTVPRLTTNNTTSAPLRNYCWLPSAAARGVKHALLRHIPAAVTFISGHLAAGKKVIIVGGGGDLDVAACIILASLIACFSLSEGGDSSQNSREESCSTGLQWSRPCVIDPETLVVSPCCIAGDEGNKEAGDGEGEGDAAEGGFSRLTVRRYAAASIAVWAPQVVLSKTLLKQVFNAFLPKRMTVPVASG